MSDRFAPPLAGRACAFGFPIAFDDWRLVTVDTGAEHVTLEVNRDEYRRALDVHIRRAEGGPRERAGFRGRPVEEG